MEIDWRQYSGNMRMLQWKDKPNSVLVFSTTSITASNNQYPLLFQSLNSWAANRRESFMREQIEYFADESVRSNLKHHTVRGGIYLALGQALRLVSQLAAIPILARLLTPADFGLVAMVTAFTAFATMFVDVGLSMATMQRPTISHDEVSNLFWIGTALGCTVAVIIAILSPVISYFYGEPRLIAITLVLCLSFVFSGLTMQHQALLRRGLQFRALAIVQTLAVVGGYTASIIWAWLYHNYWALVVFPVVSALLRMIGTWLACGWLPGLPRRRTGVWDMLAFGGYLTGFNLVNYFSRNADNMLIGWYWGAEALGFYERAYKLLMLPLQQINGPLTQLAVPALSRTLDQAERYRRAYLTILESLLLLTIPLMAFVYVTRDLCVDVLLGPQFAAAVPIFAWLGVGACFQPLTHTLGWLLISQGRTREMFQWGIFASVVSVLAFAIGLPWGTVGVAACYVTASGLIHLPTLLYWTTRVGPLRSRDLARCTTLPCCIACVVLLGILLLRQFLQTGNSFTDLGVSFIVAASLWALFMLVTSPGQRWLAYYGKAIAGK